MTILQPPDWPQPVGYASGISARGTLVFVSGQIGWDTAGRFPSGDLAAQVEGRREWLFAKLHTHGGVPRNREMLLGEPMRQFHQALAMFAGANPGFHYHYVTARELVNIVHAAEAGKTGDPAAYRDFRYASRLRPSSPVP